MKRRVRFVACGVCGIAYVNPAPTDEALRRIYSGEWGDVWREPEKLERDFDPRRFWRELDAIPKSRRRGSLLDVGCANGAFLASARRLGFSEVRGLDVSPAGVGYANQRLGAGTALCGDLLKRPFAPDSFDVVTLWATLEHLRDPGRFIEEAFRLLKPGGLFCASVPCWSGLAARWLGVKSCGVGLGHLNYFTPKGLAHLLRKHGLVRVVSQTRGFNPMAFWLDWRGRSIVEKWGPSDALREGKRNANLRQIGIVRQIERLVDCGARISGGGDLLVVHAEKPAPLRRAA
jgi:SAM-dependent methyltransferase